MCYHCKFMILTTDPVTKIKIWDPVNLWHTKLFKLTWLTSNNPPNIEKYSVRDKNQQLFSID